MHTAIMHNENPNQKQRYIPSTGPLHSPPKQPILWPQCYTSVLVILHLSQYAQMASRTCHFIFIPLLSFDSVHSRLICRSFEPSLCQLFTSWKACICTLLHSLWECNGGYSVSYCTSTSSPKHTSHKVHIVSYYLVNTSSSA